jgi:hypothetical protein
LLVRLGLLRALKRQELFSELAWAKQAHQLWEELLAERLPGLLPQGLELEPQLYQELK